MKDKKPRYQVLRRRDAIVEDYATKKEAMARVRALRAEGEDATLWDTLDNALTRQMGFSF